MKLISIPFFALMSCFCFAQTNDSLEIDLLNIQNRQQNMGKISMISLNSWAIANIGYGTIASFNSTGEAKYFHQMNAIWNVVNIGIGIPGIIGAYKNQKPKSLLELNEYQHRLEKVYFINAGLDLAYIAAGGALRLAGANKENDVRNRLQGYGNALLMQGGYLLIHDVAMIILYKTNTKLLKKTWDKVTISSYGLNLKVNFH
jgi:hypothetical protein